jgi:hypothetical protein
MGEKRIAGTVDPTALPPQPARAPTRTAAPVTRAVSVSNERSRISMMFLRGASHAIHETRLPMVAVRMASDHQDDAKKL